MSIRSLAWAGLSVAASCVAFAMLLPVTGWLALPHSVEVTILTGAWGALSLVAVLLSARLVFGRWLPVGPPALVIGVTGVGIATMLEFALLEWTRARFGYPDPDFVGWTAWLFALLVLLAMAALASFVAPLGGASVPRMATIVAAAAAILLVALNVRGLGDGIDADSWPLALLVGLAGLYAVSAAVLAFRPRAPAGPPEARRLPRD